MTVTFMTRLMALVLLPALAQAADPLQGVDAEREEARIEKEFKRASIADAYLQRIADRVVTGAPVPPATKIRIKAVVDRNPFAFCMGNGAMYVSTGLIARLENDSQVAALIAPEITGAVAPNRKLQDEFTAKNGKHLGAKVFAVMATGGMAVFPLISAENKALMSQTDALILDNDTTTAAWVRRAGFDVAAGPVATRRLHEQLGAEKKYAYNRLSSDSGLKERGAQLERAIAALPAETVPATSVASDPAEIRKLARQFSLLIAYDYLNNTHHDGLPPLLDRLEREHGVDGRTACLRAQYLHEISRGAAATANVIEAFEKCVAQPDAPVVNHRELAFLQRDAGNATAAIKSFETYLQRAPTAVDAPIIRIYIEELRAKPQ
jgi:predicted Zn-dependent protease